VECWEGHTIDPGPMVVTIAGTLAGTWLAGLRTLSEKENRSDVKYEGEDE